MPKYYSIYLDIKDRIETGVYKEGALLPFERYMEEKYNASRGTVRKALELLEKKGYIITVQGKGSIVQKRNIIFSLNDIKSLKELNDELNLNITTEVEELELIDDVELLNDLFPNEENSKIWKVKRLRKIDGEPQIIDIDFILQSKVENLSLSICRDSLYNYFENDLKIIPKQARKTITIEDVTVLDKKLLNVSDNDKVVVVESKVIDSTNSLFQVTISRHKSSGFKFSTIAYR